MGWNQQPVDSYSALFATRNVAFLHIRLFVALAWIDMKQIKSNFLIKIWKSYDHDMEIHRCHQKIIKVAIDFSQNKISGVSFDIIQ